MPGSMMHRILGLPAALLQQAWGAPLQEENGNTLSTRWGAKRRRVDLLYRPASAAPVYQSCETAGTEDAAGAMIIASKTSDGRIF
jgi:hypothetical protein